MTQAASWRCRLKMWEWDFTIQRKINHFLSSFLSWILQSFQRQASHVLFSCFTQWWFTSSAHDSSHLNERNKTKQIVTGSAENGGDEKMSNMRKRWKETWSLSGALHRVEWDGDAYLEPVCLHGVISKAVPEEANHIKNRWICAYM